jgi:ubiquinone/menaquinone biosynthesis C-methylase UbiE
MKNYLMSVNREIFNNNYPENSLCLKPTTTYDGRMITLRFLLIERFGAGKDVLDLCCGTGSYLIPIVDRVKSAVGLDFSSTMLDGFRKTLQRPFPSHLVLVEADARALPLGDESFDFVFSYASLYYVPNIQAALNEVGRVLRSGGHAALELGNLYSLNTLVSNIQHKNCGWAKPFHIPYGTMRRYLQDAGLNVVEWRAFQALPMYGAPKRLFYLYPLLSSLWKRILGIQVKGRMLDERVSGSWPVRLFAFRHLFLVTKR